MASGKVIAAVAVESRPAVVSRNPKLDFAKAGKLLAPRAGVAEVHPTAVVDRSAQLEEDVSIGAYAVVGAGAKIGRGTRIGEDTATRPKPLIEIGRAQKKDDALAGLERWKERHAEAAKHLEPADVLVDAELVDGEAERPRPATPRHTVTSSTIAPCATARRSTPSSVAPGIWSSSVVVMIA